MLVVCSIVKNRAWILPAWLEALGRLHTPCHFVFLDDASTDATRALLAEFVRTRPGSLLLHNDVPFADNDSSRSVRNRGALYAHLAVIRNRVLEAALELGADQVLSNDSDILPAPDLFTHLAASLTALAPGLGLDICGSVVCNTRTIRPTDLRRRTWSEPTNVMELRGDKVFHMRPVPLRTVVPCALTGAVMLLTRAVLEAGVRFGPHVQGEDAYFCAAARARGFRIGCDTTPRSVHVLAPRDVEVALGTWREVVVAATGGPSRPLTQVLHSTSAALP